MLLISVCIRVGDHSTDLWGIDNLAKRNNIVHVYVLIEADLDSLTDIAVFVQVVDSGSFTAAAERLNISKSVVSKYVTRLEDRLADEETGGFQKHPADHRDYRPRRP